MSIFKLVRRDQKGATAIEYGLIAALIAVAGVGAFQAVGTSIQGTFNSASTTLDTAGN